MKSLTLAAAALIALGTGAAEAEDGCNWGAMRSVGSSDGRELVVVNAVHDRSAWLYWIDFSGQPKFYAKIPPNGRHVQQTYRGHVWISENSYGHCDVIFTVENNVEIIIK